MCFNYIYIISMTSIFSKAKDMFKSNDENNENIVYYLEPTFKFINFGVFIIMLIPITLIIVYNSLDKSDAEEFANKYLETENYNMNKKTISISEDDNREDWDVIEYLKEKFDNFYNYILTKLIVKNHNGIQSINIRYNIE
jgi:ABC-type lipoprotein release transport system permease subunit